MLRVFPFKNNVPDPLLSGKELPIFKFALEKSTGKVQGGSFGKEATVEELPISKGIAGVSMRLEPGVSRELHWHATAAEWAFVLEGRVRSTVIDPSGSSEINDFNPGDVWYFPRGHGHALECIGDKPTPLHPHLRQQATSVNTARSASPDWLGHAPKALLAKNFGLPESTFRRLPQGGTLLHARPNPPATAAPLQGGQLAPAQYAPLPVMGAGASLRFTSTAASGASAPTASPISQTMTGVILELEPGGLRRAALAIPTPMNGNT